MLSILRQFLTYVMIHIKNVATRRALSLDQQVIESPSTSAEDDQFLLDLKKPSNMSREVIRSGLQTLMPFTSKFDKIVLEAAVRYYSIQHGYEKSAIKTPELEFGKWLIEVLHEKKKRSNNDLVMSVVARLMAEPSITSRIIPKNGR